MIEITITEANQILHSLDLSIRELESDINEGLLDPDLAEKQLDEFCDLRNRLQEKVDAHD